MNIFRLINLFRKTNGRSPTPSELAKLKQQAEEIATQDNVLQFPQGGKDRLSPFDDFKASEDAFEESMKPKGARPGNINYEAMQEKFPDVKLYGDESFQELLDIEKTGKHPRDKADGGRIGFKVGGILDLLNLIKRKVGKKNITTADKIKRPQSALDREMFKEFNERTNKTLVPKKPKPKTPDKALLKAMDEIGGGTGDLKYDADVLADELAFQRGLIPEGGDLTDIADQMKRMDLYDEAYSALSQQFLKNREIKKMQQFSKPTKTLKSIEDTGTIDISDPNIADEFDTFLRENNPEGYADLEQKIQLDTFDPKGRKKNAVGGLAYMLGEKPRSEYGAGGGTGAPPITYNDNVDKSGPGPTMPPNTMMNTPAIDPRMLNQGRGTGINIDPRALQNGRLQIPTQGLADGGRIGFKDGGPPNPGRRNFMKLMAGLASLPVVGKLFKGAKVASKVVPLKNTTTTMPAWFPDLVDKFVAKGVRNKIDEDMIEYTVKELPDVKMIEKTDGMISVEGKNAYNEDYFIQYEPPGYTVVDEKTGKAVKTPGEFVATDTEYRMVSPEDYDIDGVNVDDIDEILGGSSNQLEGFAKGTGKTKNTIGQRRIDEADARGASSKEEYGRTDRADVYEPYEGMDGSDFADPEDYAKGGLAKLLGE